MIFLNTIDAKKSTILTGIIWAIILFVVPALGFRYFYTVIDPSLSISNKFVISRIIFWLWLLAIYLYCVKIEKQPFLLWGESRYPIGTYVASVFLTLLTIFVGAFIIALFIKHIGFNNYSEVVQEIKHLSIPVKLLGVLTAAFVEEFIFRGYLIPRLNLFFRNVHLPILISAILFGLGHIKYGTVTNTIGPFFIGLVFGYHYYRYRNIKILIICHFVIDYLALILRH